MKTKLSNKILIAVFCFFIAFIGILFAVLPKNDYSATEKRYLASFPKLTVSSVKSGDFSEDFEEFLSDHTPFRTFFVSVNSYFELLKGNNGSAGVYNGKDGWLIEKPFSEDNGFDKNISRIKKFADETDVPVYLIPVPSKGYIYSDKLPAVTLDYKDDEYISRMKETLGKSVNIIDLTDTFIENKDEQNIFYRTDHHWTSYGAFLAYAEYCKALGSDTPDTDDYNIETYNDFYGTSYSTSCYTLTKPDTLELYRNKSTDGNAKITITEGSKVTEYDNMFFEDRLSEDDKYPVFLDGNHSRVDIETGNSGGTLLIIKDSFAHCLAPFLSEQYSRIIMIDLRYYKKDVSEILGSEDITDILFVYSIENLATSKDIILT